jgi:hypothetical protein
MNRSSHACVVCDMAWKTVDYRVEPAWIRQYPDCGKTVWFLDAIQVNESGRRSTSNICNGTREYCYETLAKIITDQKVAQ